jgi:hypothetical protein
MARLQGLVTTVTREGRGISPALSFLRESALMYYRLRCRLEFFTFDY